MKTTDRVMGKVALPIIAVAAVVLIFVMLSSSKATNDENNAYIRVINCILSKNATSREQTDVEACYVQVENESGVHLKRYDDADK